MEKNTVNIPPFLSPDRSFKSSIMDFDDEDSGFNSVFPPALVSLTPFSPSFSHPPRRLSSCFRMQSQPAMRAERPLAWVSLQGRLVGAEEGSSSTVVDRNGVFSAKEAAAWELFTPIQRVLIVAVVAAASGNSKKNGEIVKLQKSIQLRDQILFSMQQKLDNLCEQMSSIKDQPQVPTQSDEFAPKIFEYVCKLRQHHNPPPNDPVFNRSNGDEMLKSELPFSNEAHPEERRMSDLSDWSPSIASSTDAQLDWLENENEISSLRKEREEKDATIIELSAYLQSSEILSLKRIAELEDIIRRENMITNKLRKDIIILEQKVVNLSTLQRSSSPATPKEHHFPTMTDNILYGMDTTTSPSSSDSDTSTMSRKLALPTKKQGISMRKKQEISMRKKQRADLNRSNFKIIHLKENSFTPPHSVPLSKPQHAAYSSGENRSRRQPAAKSEEVPLHKRWVK